MKKFAIALAAVLALFVGTASAGDHGRNVRVVNVVKTVRVTGGFSHCHNDAVAIVRTNRYQDAVAVEVNPYDAVRLNRQVKVVNVVRGDYDDVVNVGRPRNLKVVKNVRVENDEPSGLVGAARTVANTAKNVVRTIIGN